MLRSVHRHDENGEEEPFEHLADQHVESPIEAINRQELLEQMQQHLQPIEWKVLKMHYLDGLTGRQVAQRLRLSASRICQLHLQGLDRLKQHFAAEAV